ncbi:MAG TPA: D-alanine--D-alanine ligase A, partial [Thermoanaerobaculia bacterium]|nr:D-alanine--D-alanine ligase A [Thermoanaerobaculia bacterium]
MKVVVLYGGRSVEREVSRISARTIVQALDRSKYDVLPLAVDEAGRFLSAPDSARLLAERSVPEHLRRGEPAGESLVPL